MSAPTFANAPQSLGPATQDFLPATLGGDHAFKMGYRWRTARAESINHRGGFATARFNGATPDINPNDIESIEVVKGAAAASLYGARAGGGVINMKTKSGRSAREGVTFGVRAEYGVNDIPNEFAIAKQTFLPFDPSGQLYCAEAAVGGSPCGRYINMADERRRINDVATPHALAPQKFLHDFGISNNPGRYRMLNMFQASTFPETYNQVAQATKEDLWSNTNVDMRGRVGSTGFYGSASFARQAGASSR